MMHSGTRRGFIAILLMAIPACQETLDIGQPIVLAPDHSWSTTQQEILRQAANCWNLAFGTRLTVSQHDGQGQRVPVRLNNFVCLTAAARTVYNPGPELNICRHWFPDSASRPSYPLFHALLHELGHVLNIDPHASDPRAVMYRGFDHLEYPLIRFAEEDARLLQQANSGYPARSDCDLVEIGRLEQGQWGCSCFYSRRTRSPPTKSTLRALWGNAPDAIWAVGQDGTILKYDGDQWSQVPTEMEITRDLNSIWGRSASDIWAVGQEGFILHYDGESWQNVPSGTARTLWSVHGGTVETESGQRESVWAVGVGGIILEHDGTWWREVPSGTQQHLYGVRRIDEHNVWAVGQEGTMLKRGERLYQEWTKEVYSYTSADLHSVWGSSGIEVWASGGDGTLVQFNGVSCTRFIVEQTVNLHAGLVGHPEGSMSDGHLWVVGDAGTILRWPVPEAMDLRNIVAFDSTSNLYAVIDDGQGGVWAAGDAGTLLHVERVSKPPR